MNTTEMLEKQPDPAASDVPRVSVIVPVRNAADDLRVCLECLQASRYENFEIIVVDDASTDSTPEVALEHGVRLERMDRQTGPAGARNHGARIAEGEYLFFVDADVCVYPGTIQQVVDSFAEGPEWDAVFGSYDRRPRKRNVISQYKNLSHHFVHQEGRKEAVTFWAGCGAIKRSVFLEMCGFDTGYGRPCIEDIELGARLHKAGRRIMLNKEIQVTHLKRWTLWSVFKTDFWDRALPWTALMLRDRQVPNDLNLKTSQRVCALLACGLFAMLLVGAWYSPGLLLLPLCGLTAIQGLDWWSLERRVSAPVRIVAVLFALSLLVGLSLYSGLWVPAALVIVLVIVLLNYRYYAFFARERHLLFAALVVPLHLAYYLYSTTAFGIGLLLHFFERASGAMCRRGRGTPERLAGESEGATSRCT